MIKMNLITWLLFKLEKKINFGFYADASFLYGHAQKYAKKFKDKKYKIKVNQGFEYLNKLPIIIFYSKLCKEQIISNLQSDFDVGEIDSNDIFLNSIKKYKIIYLPIPTEFKNLSGKMMRKFKELEKTGKSEDCLHLCMAIDNKLPAITSEKNKKLELWKEYYKYTISTSKFWLYIKHLRELQTREKITKEKAELILRKFL